ncbi:MAG: phenylalanine--tRNA ligase subunit alpha, partial [Thermodesulfobacteriota bacterium]|nr:phenylalanine--tRNA ligase subunit alpha [Thermodesulfobacteriota bacterium]
MKEKIQNILNEINEFKSENLETLENFRIKFLGKKGQIQDLFLEFKNIPKEQRKEMGLLLNELKNKAKEKLNSEQKKFQAGAKTEKSEKDFTIPVDFIHLGARHPLSIIRNEINDIFSRIGFTVNEGPEIEDDFHNFTALNFPKDHPARDMQDTFFIEKDPDIALRTHTSSVQVRAMENSQPPIREIYPGRVFRNEAISARAHCIFHQVEGLYVDKDVSFADLKQTLFYFAKEMFGEETKIRFRPS